MMDFLWWKADIPVTCKVTENNDKENTYKPAL